MKIQVIKQAQSSTIPSNRKECCQYVQAVDNRMYFTKQQALKKAIQRKEGSTVLQCAWPDITSGISSIVGGSVMTITGGRDMFNAIKDVTHRTILLNNNPLNMNPASGSLEITANGGTPNPIVKAKVKGTLLSVYPNNQPSRHGPPGTKRRIVEGGLNTLAGLLGVGAGITSLAGGKIPSALLSGGSTLSTGGAAITRLLRSYF